MIGPAFGFSPEVSDPGPAKKALKVGEGTDLADQSVPFGGQLSAPVRGRRIVVVGQHLLRVQQSLECISQPGFPPGQVVDAVAHG